VVVVGDLLRVSVDGVEMAHEVEMFRDFTMNVESEDVEERERWRGRWRESAQKVMIVLDALLLSIRNGVFVNITE
jgi:hypothetical protein